MYVSDGGHRAIAVDRIALGDDVVDVKAVLDENDQGRNDCWCKRKNGER